MSSAGSGWPGERDHQADRGVSTRWQVQAVHERTRSIAEGIVDLRHFVPGIGGEHLRQRPSIERGGTERIRLHQGENSALAIDGDGLAVPDELADGAHPTRRVQELRGRIDLERPHCQYQRDRLRPITEIPDFIARNEL